MAVTDPPMEDAEPYLTTDSVVAVLPPKLPVAQVMKTAWKSLYWLFMEDMELGQPLIPM